MPTELQCAVRYIENLPANSSDMWGDLFTWRLMIHIYNECDCKENCAHDYIDYDCESINFKKRCTYDVLGSHYQKSLTDRDQWRIHDYIECLKRADINKLKVEIDQRMLKLDSVLGVDSDEDQNDGDNANGTHNTINGDDNAF